ncbi:MAG TPA: hypothetical protein DDW93_01355 [Firmicutes bacterium]|nr:hypothetical protein [Bacillota bacterium]HBK69280.1 hypothetical protein [Bacillota bacterium]HBT17279.1 hypothetical protein [Bacillota bacterium]
MPRKIFVLLFMIMIIITTTLPGSSNSNHILLKAATINGADSAEAVGLAVFKELVEKRTKGYIKINIHTDGVLGNDEQLIKGMQRGTVDLVTCASFKYADYVPRFKVLELPFLFFSTEHLRTMLNGTLGQDLAESALSSRGDIVLGYITSCPVNIISVKAIPFLSQAKGLRFRSMLLPSHRQTWQSLGMAPVTLVYSELKIGMQVGMIDMAETDFIDCKKMKLYETAKFILPSEHYFPVSPLLLSKLAWYKIPQSYRAILQDCAKEAIDYGTDYFSQKNKETAKELTDKYWVKIADFNLAEKKTHRSRLAADQRKVFSGLGLDRVWAEINSTFEQYELEYEAKHKELKP